MTDGHAAPQVCAHQDNEENFPFSAGPLPQQFLSQSFGEESTSAVRASHLYSASRRTQKWGGGVCGVETDPGGDPSAQETTVSYFHATATLFLCLQWRLEERCRSSSVHWGGESNKFLVRLDHSESNKFLVRLDHSARRTPPDGLNLRWVERPPRPPWRKSEAETPPVPVGQNVPMRNPESETASAAM